MIRHSKFWNKKIDFLAVKAGLLPNKQQKIVNIQQRISYLADFKLLLQNNRFFVEYECVFVACLAAIQFLLPNGIESL